MGEPPCPITVGEVGAEAGASGDPGGSPFEKLGYEGRRATVVSWRRKQNQRRLCLVKGERLEHFLNAKWQGPGRGWGPC